MASYITTHSLAIKKIQTTDGAQHAVDAKYWDGEEFNKDLFQSTVETHVIDTSKSTGSKLRIATSSTTKTVSSVSYSDINAVWGEDETFTTEIWNLFHDGDTFLNTEQGYVDWWISATTRDSDGNPTYLTLQAVETGMNHHHGISRTSTTFSQITGVTTSTGTYAKVGGTTNVIYGLGDQTTTKPTNGVVVDVAHSGTWTPSITIADATAGDTGSASPQHSHTYLSTVASATAAVITGGAVCVDTLEYAQADTSTSVLTTIPTLAKTSTGNHTHNNAYAAGTVKSTSTVSDALKTTLNLATTSAAGSIVDNAETIDYVTGVNFTSNKNTSEYTSNTGTATDTAQSTGTHNHGGSVTFASHSHTVTITFTYVGNTYQNATSAEAATVTEVTTAAQISAAASLAAADNLAVIGTFFADNVLSFAVAERSASTNSAGKSTVTTSEDGAHSHSLKGHTHSLNAHTHTYYKSVATTKTTQYGHTHGNNVTVVTSYSTTAYTGTIPAAAKASSIGLHTHNANVQVAKEGTASSTALATGYGTSSYTVSGTDCTVSLGSAVSTTKTSFITSVKTDTGIMTLKTGSNGTSGSSSMKIGATSSDYTLPGPTSITYRTLLCVDVKPAKAGVKPVVTVASSKYTVYEPSTSTGAMVTD